MKGEQWALPAGRSAVTSIVTNSKAREYYASLETVPGTRRSKVMATAPLSVLALYDDIYIYMYIGLVDLTQ